MRRILPLLFFALVLAGGLGLASQAPAVSESKVDEIFSRWTNDSPGCAVGVTKAGQPVLQNT